MLVTLMRHRMTLARVLMCKPKFCLGISINRCLSTAETLTMLGDRGAQHLGWPCEDRGGNWGE